jgi:hypothetical protein
VDLSTQKVCPIDIYKSKYRINYPTIDCSGLSAWDIVSSVFDQCRLDEIKGKIIKCNLKNVDLNQYKKINRSMFSEIRDQCIDLKIDYEFNEEKLMDMQMSGANLSEEFSKYIGEELSKKSFNKELKDKVLKYGSDLMNEVEKARNTEVLNK